MKPLNLAALLLFIAGTAFALTRSESTVREIQHGYYALIGPALKSGTNLANTANALTREFDHSKELELKLAAAEAERDSLRIIAIRVRELEAENNKLRNVLDFQKQTPFNVIATRVIRRNPSTWWQEIIIDRGEEADVTLNSPVLNASGLVGKVENPESGLSPVILLTDESCQVAAKVEGTHEVGILSGRRGQLDANPLLSLRFLSKDAPVRPGMRVFSSGDGGLFPPNILLGTVESVIPGASESEALVRPSVDFENLDVVFVVTGTKSQ